MDHWQFRWLYAKGKENNVGAYEDYERSLTKEQREEREKISKKVYFLEIYWKCCEMTVANMACSVRRKNGERYIETVVGSRQQFVG